jgi:hypothetical protein
VSLIRDRSNDRVSLRSLVGVWAVLATLAGCTAEPLPSPAPAVRGVRWERLLPAPTARTEVTAASDGVRVFVIGGLVEGGRTVATVEAFDPMSGSWEAAPDLPVPVNHAMSTSLGGAVYVFGGYSGPGLANPSDQAFVLHDGSWRELPRMPESRAAAGAAVVEDKMYVAGGVGSRGLADRVLVFDPALGAWSKVAGLPTRREHLGVAGFDGRLYVVGGRTKGIGTNLGALEAYDPSTNMWFTLPDMPTPRGGIAAISTSNGFVAAAGGESDTTFDEVEAFDVRSGRWISLPSLPTARHGLGMAVLGTVLYVIAGGPEPGLAFSAANEAIDLAGLGH